MEDSKQLAEKTRGIQGELSGWSTDSVHYSLAGPRRSKLEVAIQR